MQSFCTELLDKQTNKQRWKHILLGGGKISSPHIQQCNSNQHICETMQMTNMIASSPSTILCNTEQWSVNGLSCSGCTQSNCFHWSRVIVYIHTNISFLSTTWFTGASNKYIGEQNNAATSVHSNKFQLPAVSSIDCHSNGWHWQHTAILHYSGILRCTSALTFPWGPTLLRQCWHALQFFISPTHWLVSDQTCSSTGLWQFNLHWHSFLLTFCSGSSYWWMPGAPHPLANKIRTLSLSCSIISTGWRLHSILTLQWPFFCTNLCMDAWLTSYLVNKLQWSTPTTVNVYDQHQLL